MRSNAGTKIADALFEGARTAETVVSSDLSMVEADDDRSYAEGECINLAEAFATMPGTGMSLWGKPAAPADVLAAAVRAGMNPATGRGQYPGALTVVWPQRGRVTLFWGGEM